MYFSQKKYKLFLSLFFLSGFAGLIYESVWTHYIKILVGHAAFAQSFVLIVFLAGLSIGSWLGGEMILRFARKFFIYALAEILIGIFALLFHPSFELLSHLSSGGNVNPGSNILIWFLIILLTLPFTILLGATFPLLASALQNSCAAKRSRVVSYLYFLNSAGASLGILASGFFIIPEFGLPGTILIAGILNLLIGFAALFLSGKSLELSIALSSTGLPKTSGHRSYFAIIAVAALTGLSSMMYEVGWIRLLSMMLGSAVQSFELMLSAFIFGLAMGAWYIGRRIDKIKNPWALLVRLQLIMGMLALVSLLVYNQSYYLMEIFVDWLPRNDGGFWMFNLGSNFIAFLVMLPATICAGMTLPLMISVLQNEGEKPSVIGKVYAMNTLGGILGVGLAFHVFMPFLGLKYLMIIAGAFDIFAGIALMVFYRFRVFLLTRIMAGGAILMVLMAILFFHPNLILMSSGVFRYGKIDKQKEILFHKDGTTASITVAETDGGNVVLSTNGKPDASLNVLGRVSNDQATQVLLAALPMWNTPKLDHVAVVGLGSGITAHTLLMDQEIRSVDVVEIEPAVAEALQFFRPYIDNIYHDHRLHLYIDDARNFLSTSQKKYDLIISEPSNPWVSGMSGLFSGQFYKSVNRALSDEGVFVQWMHIYEMNMPLLVSVIKAFSPHFNDYQIYFLDDGDIVLMGKKAGNLGFSQGDIFSNDFLRHELLKLGIESDYDFLLRFVGNKQGVDSFFHTYPYPANSDYFPILEYEAPKARFLNQSVSELETLITSPVPVLQTLTRMPKVSVEGLGPDYAFTLSEKYRRAQTIFGLFDEVRKGNRVTYGEIDYSAALLVRNILSIQFGIHDGDFAKIWHLNLGDFSEMTMPFLDVKQMEVIWDVIETAPGYAFLNDPEKLDIKLYLAIGDKDYPNILSLTRTFRNNLPKDLNDKGKLQLSVSVWAFIELGQIADAKKLLADYPKEIEADVVLRFMSSYVLDGDTP